MPIGFLLWRMQPPLANILPREGSHPCPPTSSLPSPTPSFPAAIRCRTVLTCGCFIASSITRHNELGAAYRAQNIDYRARAAECRAQNLTWLAGINEELADAMETDARRAAVSDLRVAAHFGQLGPDIDTMVVNWYGRLLTALVEQQLEKQAARPVREQLERSLALIAAE